MAKFENDKDGVVSVHFRREQRQKDVCGILTQMLVVALQVR